MTDFVEQHRALLSRLTAAWVTSGVILYVLAPRSAPALLVLSMVAPVGWSVASRRLPLSKPSAMTILLVVGAPLAVAALALWVRDARHEFRELPE